MPILTETLQFKTFKFSWHFALTSTKTQKIEKNKINLRRKIAKMYSVSETIENGTLCVTSHPDIWVKDEILLWPPSGSGIERKEIIAPGPDWTQYKCKVLRENIGKYFVRQFCVFRGKSFFFCQSFLCQ